MNGTPRLRSAFPSTPQSTKRTPVQNGSLRNTAAASSPKLPDIASLRKQGPDDQPFIPFEYIDAPSQRFYVAGLYVALQFWRLYDFWILHQDETESLWLFMKWDVLDGIFLFTLPALRIPWLEWQYGTMMLLFAFHAVFNGILMFRIPIPFIELLVWLGKTVYDRETALSERSVNPKTILNDPSHILGAFTINVLPEGSALLNPQQLSICLDRSKNGINIPIQINQTNPSSIELFRYDLDTLQNDTIRIPASQIKKMRKAVSRQEERNGFGAVLLQYPITKPGLYRLGKVTDESYLEVAHPVSETLVVQCPSARMVSAGANRCRGDLSNVAIQVHGSPPLKIKYRKIVDGDERDITYQSIQPDDFTSPFTKPGEAGPLVSTSSPDMTWAAASTITVPLNETLTKGGKWSYSIDEVSDALGNVVAYTLVDSEYETPKPKAAHLEDFFVVHERPIAALDGYHTKKPLRASKGGQVKFPVKLSSTGRKGVDAGQHLLTYRFTPDSSTQGNADQSPAYELKQANILRDYQPTVSEPGLYTLESISSPVCAGEIEEPASFVLVNPPEPSLEVSHQSIVDKCANRPIGIQVELTMTGIPPFEVVYTTQRNGRQLETGVSRFNGPRGQLEFKPDAAGHYAYEFTQMSDEVYKGVDMKGKLGKLQQEVRPSVSASFTERSPRMTACIDEPVTFEVKFQGEGPWTLEYELVHGRRRSKHVVSDIEDQFYTIITDRLTEGGEYSLVLVGVKDTQGCREALQQDAKISVRHQRPKAGFGQIEGKRAVKTLESKHVDLPLRLSGEGPWSIDYRHSTNDSSGQAKVGKVLTKQITNANDFLAVSDPGVYEVLRVQDIRCPGAVDETAKTFEVSWVGRPQISVAEGPLVTVNGDKHVRNEVCEGDDDTFDISLSGRPPFEIEYDEHVKPDNGDKSLRKAVINAPMHSAQIVLNTVEPGLHEYVFTNIEDYNYNKGAKRQKPMIVQQRVYGRPSASFTAPGKVYSFCQQSASNSLIHEMASATETIPLTLKGQPPFTVDFEVRSHAGGKTAGKPQTFTIPNIEANSHQMRVPERLLQPGTSVLTVRRIRDSRGCERLFDSSSMALSKTQGSKGGKGNAQSGLQQAPRVQIAVHDAPSLHPLDSPERRDYCVGERLGFALTGSAPFTVFYDFGGKPRKASVSSPTFRRIAETAGNLTVTGVQDSASACKAEVKGITRMIHELPRVRVSKGKAAYYDIHAGSSVDVLFEFSGTAPFEFTYTRSETPKKGSGGHGKGKVLETRTLTSQEWSMTVSESEEGTYEVVAIRDRYCSYAKPGYGGTSGGAGVGGLGIEDVRREGLLEY